MKTLTISRKIALGFTALILITGGLGGLSVSSMRSVQSAVHTLANEDIPEVDVTGDLKSDISAAALAIRSYGFTADATYLVEARKQLALVRTDFATAQKLVADHPNLGRLHEDVGQLAVTLKSFETAVAATETRNNEIAASRAKLDSAAAGFIATIDRLIESQKTRLQTEIKAGGESAQHLERFRKVVLAQEIRGLGNSARIGTFKAQALRDPKFFTEALQNFTTLEARLTELHGLLKVKTDLTDLDQVKADAFVYRDAVKAMMDDSVALVEIGQTRAAAVGRLIAIADGTQTAGMKRTAEAASRSEQRLAVSSTTTLIGIAVALIVGILVALFISRSTSKVLTTVAEAMGDSSAQVTAAATQVASASQALASGASEQAASLEETSASLEEMASMTKRNAESAQQAKELSTHTRSSADTGAAHMLEMRQAMDAIKASSDDIAKIIKTIDEIAFQTNILALNAAVEAARAGEAGMGFAVVAEEVRSLAQRSAHSAKETATKIEDAISKSEHGVIVSVKVAASLTDIVNKARQMDTLISEIATASSEQNQGIHQLNGAVSQIDQITQSNASGAEESAAAAQQLNAQAFSMQQAVADLRALVTHDEAQAGAPEPKAASSSAAKKPALVAPARPSKRPGSSAPKGELVATAAEAGSDLHFRD
jgi:methyl-accepting chemotaxis protein